MRNFRLKGLIILVCILFGYEYCSAQTMQLENIPENDVWDLIEYSLREKGLLLESAENSSSQHLSTPEQYSSGHSIFRIKYIFTYEDNLLTIGIFSKEVKRKSGWIKLSFKKNISDQKKVDEMASLIKSGNDVILAKRSPAGEQAITTSFSSGQTSGYIPLPNIRNAKIQAFDEGNEYEFSEGLCAVKRGLLWGFLDTTGNIVIAFNYMKARIAQAAFHDGVCVMAKNNDEYGLQEIYIDRNGKELFQDKGYSSITPFSGGLAIVERKNPNQSRLFGFINTKGLSPKGAVTPGVLPGIKLDFVGFSEGLAYVLDDSIKSWGYINLEGKWVIKPNSNYSMVDIFHDGLAFVQENTEGKWGAINTKGELVIPYLYLVKPSPFSEGLSAVKNSDGKVGYIDKAGNMVVDFKYESPFGVEVGFPFKNGTTIVFRNGNYYSLNVRGVEIKKVGDSTAEIVYQPSGFFTFKFWTSQNNWGIGLMKSNGDILIEPNHFTSIGDFVDGLAYAKANIHNKVVSGFINLQGDFVIIQKKSDSENKKN